MEELECRKPWQELEAMVERDDADGLMRCLLNLVWKTCQANSFFVFGIAILPRQELAGPPCRHLTS